MRAIFVVALYYIIDAILENEGEERTLIASYSEGQVRCHTLIIDADILKLVSSSLMPNGLLQTILDRGYLQPKIFISRNSISFMLRTLGSNFLFLKLGHLVNVMYLKSSKFYLHLR